MGITPKAIAVVGILGLFWAASPRAAASQGPATVTQAQGEEGCTAKCECSGTSCTCYATGGAGASASCPGNGTCTVQNCQPQFVRTTQPDGSASPLVAGVRTGTRYQWETTSTGVAVARDCAQVVVARYVDAAAAASLRRSTRELAI